MNSLVGQQQGYPDMMDEIPRTYYPGRGYLSDQEAYPENPFYRSPRYSGGIYDGAFQNIPPSRDGFHIAQNPMNRFDLMNDPRFPGARRTRDFLRQTEQGVPLDKRNMGREIFPLPLAAVGADQQPAQGPNTPVKNYPGMGYGPYGPGGGGLPPAPVRQANNAGFYMGGQAGQADQYPALASGFLTKYLIS